MTICFYIRNARGHCFADHSQYIKYIARNTSVLGCFVPFAIRDSRTCAIPAPPARRPVSLTLDTKKPTYVGSNRELALLARSLNIWVDFKKTVKKRPLLLYSVVYVSRLVKSKMKIYFMRRCIMKTINVIKVHLIKETREVSDDFDPSDRGYYWEASGGGWNLLFAEPSVDCTYTKELPQEKLIQAFPPRDKKPTNTQTTAAPVIDPSSQYKKTQAGFVNERMDHVVRHWIKC